MEAMRSSGTSVHIRHTQRHIPEDGILQYNVLHEDRLKLLFAIKSIKMYISDFIEN
jgi:hypothetical protein